jgi:hypothetical protein
MRSQAAAHLFPLIAFIAGLITAPSAKGGGYASDHNFADQTVVTGQGQQLRDSKGNTFMEEVPTPQVKQPPLPRSHPIPDLSTLNVPVNPNGEIVPLINRSSGPVLPFYSQFEQTVQPLWQFAPAYSSAYPVLPYAYSVPYPAYQYYTGYRPNWRLQYSTRTPFGNFASFPQAPYAAPGLAPISPWFVPPVVSYPPMPTEPGAW